MSIDDRYDMADREEREYFRVRSVLPLRHVRARDQEVETFVAEMETISRDPSPEKDATMAEQLDRVERKVDRLLSLLDPSHPVPLDDADKRPLEISGSGVRYPWPEMVEPGELLKLQFILASSPPRTIRCIGRVVSCREPDLPHRSRSLAVAYEHITEADRDAIVRYTLEVERLAKRAAVDEDAE